MKLGWLYVVALILLLLWATQQGPQPKRVCHTEVYAQDGKEIPCIGDY